MKTACFIFALTSLAAAQPVRLSFCDGMTRISREGTPPAAQTHTLHAAHGDFALSRGLATLVDKPFVMKSADARRLIATATSKKLLNAVAFNRRLDAGCRRARLPLRGGATGRW